MITKFKPSLFLLIFLWSILPTMAQREISEQSLSAEALERYKEDVARMISFLQFTFNTLGDADVPVKEKDIIINQSWDKMFKNQRVQIEDDLDENRETPINKDVQAYLKDIDFFFNEVAFTFTIQSIEHFINESGQHYFLVTFNRNLKGTLLNGNKIDSNKLRFAEINLDDSNKDLKIVSIYTTKLNEKEELRRWWSELPVSWRIVLGEHLVVKDTLKMKHILWYNDSVAGVNMLIQRRINQGSFTLNTFDTLKIALSDNGIISAGLLDKQIQKIIEFDTINIASNKKIYSLEPLTKLTQIKYLNFSNTAIINLMPIRNLSYLETMDGSNTLVDDLDVIRYLNKLKELNLANTKIKNLEPLSNFASLQRLNIANTQVFDLQPIALLNNLTDLNFSGTKISSLQSISSLTSLDRLDFSATKVTDISLLKDLKSIVFLKFENTSVSDLSPLSYLKDLNLLFIDHTPVSDLTPLNALPNLTKVYCDQTQITRIEAVNFMEQNPGVLVVYETYELIKWWNDLPAEWKKIFSDKVANVTNPTKDELHDVTRLKILNIANNKDITSLQPLTNLTMLDQLYCQGSGINDLRPLMQLTELKDLNLSSTKVSDLTPLKNSKKLNRLLFDNTDVSSVLPLMELTELRTLYCDNSPVIEDEIVEFLLKHPDCQVIYRTEELLSWWDGLPEIWKLIAADHITYSTQPNREQLHELTNLRKLDLDANKDISNRLLEITNLDPLKNMILLESLIFSNTRVTSLSPLSGMSRLKSLVCTNNPVESLQPLSNLLSLEFLDIQNTLVKQLALIGPLRNLKKLNCSGTQIKNLKGVEFLENLEQIDCFNTKVKNLKPLQNLSKLRLIRCYNSNLSARTVAKFKALRPEVEIVFY